MTGILLMYCKQYKVTDVPDELLDTLAEVLAETLVDTLAETVAEILDGTMLAELEELEELGDALVGPVFHKA